MGVPFKVVIPARYASTRLPGKPLLPIAGKAMILHVCARADEAGADEIIVATDNQKILDVVNDAGFKAVMTREDHNSGTERISEVADICAWDDDQIIVNLQGDEPLLPPQYISEVAQALAVQQQAGIATLAAAIQHSEEIFNSNVVKVVLNKQGYALYFSRAPIPWDRDAFNQENNPTLSKKIQYLRHIGLYAYTVGFVKRYISWRASPLETVEMLEQLRILWHGESVLVVKVPEMPEGGVDTAEDLQRVERVLSK
jgi:3-deoxy-manno-octulosonate cytidylyltransferase (CMP-KDO synthetase)